MPIVRETLRRWLPVAAAIAVLCLLIYASVQQAHRSGADDPQIQMAEDAVRALESGATVASVLPAAKVEIERGLAPFVIVYDAQGQPVAGSGMLRGHLPAPPQGVFDFVRTNGEERVTWQPERGVRIASVVRRSAAPSAGFVLAGRSLREVEAREANLRNMCALALLAALGGSLLVAGLAEGLLGPRPRFP
jgi:hypothetical protein